MADRNDYLCPKCGAPMVHETRHDRVTYKRRSATFEQPGWWCPSGHEAVLSMAEARVADEAMRDLRNKVDAELGVGAMTAPEVRRIRQRVGLSLREASRLLGGGKHGFERYESGTAEVTTAMATLLRLLDRHPDLLAEIRAGKDTKAA